MSIVQRCDNCEDETDRCYVHDRYKPILFSNHPGENPLRIQAEVMVAIDGAWNNGNLCKECLLILLTEGSEARTG